MQSTKTAGELGTQIRKKADLMGKNIVVYDLEIKEEIGKNGIGWKSFDKMGISVGCAFDYRSYKFRVFMDDNIRELVERLNEENTLVVAFNHVSFDNNLLRGNGLPLKDDRHLKNYDMLLESRKGAGAVGFIKGFTLDEHLKEMKLPVKTGNGALAPIWWQEGKAGKVIDYCLNDVMVEKQLFDEIYLTGRMASAYNPNGYNIERPVFV
jgi:hypothetical protein